MTTTEASSPACSTPDLLELDPSPSLSSSFSMATLPSISNSPTSESEFTTPLDDDDEDSSEVTVNQPIRPSDYVTRPASVIPNHSSPEVIAPQPSRPAGLLSAHSNLNPDSPLPPVPTIDRFDSPLSLSSWYASDLVSYPASSISGSLDGDRDHLSDHEPGESTRNGPLTDGEGEEISDEDGAYRNGLQVYVRARSQFDETRHNTHSRTREFLSTITGHLVMPRLPIHHPYSNTPSPGSSLRGGVSPRSAGSSSGRRPTGHYPHREARSGRHDQHQRTLPDQASSFQAWTSSLAPKTRVLLLGDDDCSVCKPSFYPTEPIISVQRASELVAGFKISIPATHHALFSHISLPFTRLRPLLNPHALHSASLAGSCNEDLNQLIERWVINEAYLVALVEITHAPLSPETLSFLLSLSRLVPILPFVSHSVTGSSAVDLHAILNRQLAAKRIHHLPIPCHSSSPSSPELPLSDCIIRTRDCFLDWIVVEEAALRALSTSKLPTVTNLGMLRSTIDHEPDRWSEKLGERILYLSSNQSSISRKQQKRHRTVNVPIRKTGISSDPFGFPSISSILYCLFFRRPRPRPPWFFITAAATVFTVWGYSLLCG
ncbi:hypothetical protein CROQUDRAFT_90697 [Cronartium quercuum f. sp. fusiforme G11]|uniref:Uncharacterized protein n=1 Tax=Cronartium quercuum f. sp. fusiforme G11 TaxID=708437 RepID=A0A9P6NQ33_9BASI|nr:hypothetical protein CROQUDRAFT_90697 [Cronartium quercuum f. sp. fusiforme G11]